jgi:hypothetical protein
MREKIIHNTTNNYPSAARLLHTSVHCFILYLYQHTLTYFIYLSIHMVIQIHIANRCCCFGNWVENGIIVFVKCLKLDLLMNFIILCEYFRH